MKVPTEVPVSWRWPFCHGALCVALTMLLAASGCTLIPRRPRAPQAAVPSPLSSDPGRTRPLAAAELQAKVMSFADGFIYVLAETCTDLEPRLTDPRERAALQTLKLNFANTALLIASGPNSSANLLDMVALVTLGRMNVEHYWLPEVFGPDCESLLATFRRLEQEIWTTAGSLLTPSQQDELRTLLDEWRDAHPGPRAAEYVYLSEFARARQATPAARSRTGSLLGLFYLDPLASLDPTTRVIEESRQVAERSMFFLKRAPTLLRWQTELLAHNVSALPETRQLLNDISGFRQATENFTKVIEQLPGRLGDEQRKLLADVVGEEERLRAMLTDVEKSMATGREMAAAVELATTALDTFVGRFDRPPATNGVATAPSSRPFDVLEYGTAATEIARSAQELTRLVESLDRLLASPALEQPGQGVDALAQRIETTGRRLLRLAFLYGLALIGALTVGLGMVRWLPRRRDKTGGHG
jgi:hypothetical protein